MHITTKFKSEEAILEVSHHLATQEITWQLWICCFITMFTTASHRSRPQHNSMLLWYPFYYYSLIYA